MYTVPEEIAGVRIKRIYTVRLLEPHRERIESTHRSICVSTGAQQSLLVAAAKLENFAQGMEGEHFTQLRPALERQYNSLDIAATAAQQIVTRGEELYSSLWRLAKRQEVNAWRSTDRGARIDAKYAAGELNRLAVRIDGELLQLQFYMHNNQRQRNEIAMTLAKRRWT
jgi:hypothetical protein